MADIDTELAAIANTALGEDVRDAIIEAMEKINEQTCSTLTDYKKWVTDITPLLTRFALLNGETLPVTENGVFNVASYNNVSVSVVVTPLLRAMIERTGDSQRVSISGVSYIGSYAFYSMQALREASFANAEIIGDAAFQNCTNLVQCSAPLASAIGSHAFAGCVAIGDFQFPTAYTIGSGCFAGCSRASRISVPNVDYIPSEAFADCASVTSMEFTEASGVGSWAFQGCTNLSTLTLPNARTFNTRAFAECSSLSTLSLPAARDDIEEHCFAGCSALSALYLPNLSYIPRLVEPATDTFAGTPIAEGDGRVYVPAHLLSEYRSRQYWSTIASHIVAIT